MFTGIIEALGTISSIRKEGTNVHFAVTSPMGNELKVDQSVSHNGVCLTVARQEGNIHHVTAILETLTKSNLSKLQVGDRVNLERSMLNNGRFDGHIVQGHVDQIGICVAVKDEGGSWIFDFEYDPGLGNMTIEKGSISVNGTSLTCFNSRRNGFSVAIIPYTFEHTNFHQIRAGDSVNLEFDVVGKYIQKMVMTGKAIQ